MAKIYLQRHTRPDVEPNICYGVSDIELHAEFESTHLPEVINRLEGIKVTKIYSSPLKRCRRLADKIMKSMDLSDITDIAIDDRALELNFGDWELTSWDDIFKSSDGKMWFNDYINYRTPNGEAFADMLVRAESFWEEVKASDDNVMVVTHSGFMRAMMIAAGVISKEEAFSVKIEYGELVEL